MCKGLNLKNLDSHLARCAPQAVAADLKATSHAADPLNEMKKKKFLVESEGFRCKNRTKKVSKRTKLEPKGNQYELRNLQKDTLAEHVRKKYPKRVPKDANP